MTLMGKSVIARYDSDLSATLETTEKLLAKYPKDVNLQLARIACLSELGKAKDRIEMLRELNAAPECHPMFWTQLASELLYDAREKESVDYLIRRSLKYQGATPAPYSLIGAMMTKQENIAFCPLPWDFLAPRRRGATPDHRIAARTDHLKRLTDAEGSFGLAFHKITPNCDFPFFTLGIFLRIV